MEFKNVLALLFLFCAVFVQSAESFKVQKTLSEIEPLLESLFRVERSLRDDDQKETINYRLPNDSIPLRYDLWLKTNVDAGDFKFQGRVKIHIQILKATQKITLNYREIEIDNIDLVDGEQNIISANLGFEYEKLSEFVKISLPREMAVNDEIVLDISYNGELMYGSRSNQGGFHRGFCEKNAEKEIWFAALGVLATDSRHAMPCYDEPAIRAVIALQIEHNKSLNANSIMPIVSREEVAGSDFVTTKFQDTLPIPTHLLIFFLSDLKFVSNNDTKVEQRVYAQPKSIENGNADPALNFVGPVLRKLEEIFDVDFPLSILDHKAFTRIGGFGLAIDNTLLLSGKILKAFFAFQIAFQYFENIAAPEWWSHRWINRGLAELYSHHILNLLYPEEGFDEDLKTSLSDSFKNPEKIKLNNYFESPHDIQQSPDSPEALNVLYMFQDALSLSTFTKGIKYYLKSANFSSSTADDLHRELQKAYDEDFPENKIDIGEAMKTWEEQSGYPTIHVEKTGNKFVLTQKNKVKDNDDIFTIPFSYKLKSGKASMVWMKTKIMEIETENDDDWITFNANITGFYEIRFE
jgi:aminopeptidase N